MDFTQWSQLALICVMGAMSPGPSLAVILRNSVSGGRQQGIMTGIGHGLGITFYALVAVAGLVAMFKTIPHFFTIAQIAGSVFLIWLGSKMIISALSLQKIETEKEHSQLTGRQGFIEGFLIAFLNPKIAAWLLALFSQFVQADAAFPEQIVLVTTVGGIDAAWYCFVALLASSGGLVESLKRNAKRIELGMGILLILLAAGMLMRAYKLFG
jgi:threonine/homoserine/homoserine lactone efflux protein